MPRSEVLDLLINRLFLAQDKPRDTGRHDGAYLTYYVVPGGEEPRWLIPADAKAGLATLRYWRPYGLLSRIFWQLLLSVYSCRLLGFIPGITSLKLDISTTGHWKSENFIPVVYVGTPGPQRKAVVTLVTPATGEPQSILKAALSDGATSSIAQEARVLDLLAAHPEIGAPQLLWVDGDCSRSMQSFVPGKLSERSLTSEHIQWLVRLPRTGRMITLVQRRAELERGVRHCHDAESNITEPALNLLENNFPLPEILVHGDFSPWNLKVQVDEGIAAIDWEAANTQGMPLHDISHFFMMQSHLFGGSDVMSILTESPLVAEYLHLLGIDRTCLEPLVIHYLLSMISGQYGECSKEYREFLLIQTKKAVFV